MLKALCELPVEGLGLVLLEGKVLRTANECALELRVASFFLERC